MLPRFLRSDLLLSEIISGFYSLFSVTEEPFVTSGGNFDHFAAMSGAHSVQINGWAFIGKIRKIR